MTITLEELKAQIMSDVCIVLREDWEEDDRADLCKRIRHSFPDNTDDVSDGYHTFGSLYFQRCVLFAALCNTYKTLSWKSRRHEDGEECFGGGWFIVGIDTPEGSYTYHYENKYWDMFKCQELEVGKHWDGHTDKDVERLLGLCAWKEK